MSYQQQMFSPPPPANAYPSQYHSKDSWGSIGPVIGVLAVITVLGIIAGVIGRLCSGRRIVGLGQYDFQGWIERKCASCIDGGTGSTAPAPVTASAASAAATEEIVRQRSEAQPEAKHSPLN
ncbi:uncharacterized protein LOC110035763 [Phalaenopsis equestris]|uniref:uncharacterized protein LOC110035763 n=1 Tax=Phalaenopsis equestris TaxID=78828 RepID=UPI0009E4ADFE|nr:uncharacterized protein LOC110035763 [Phalaenopsis equestris]